MSPIRLRALEGIPEIANGDSIAATIASAGPPAAGEVVCISQKIVSKAEGRVRDLDQVEPSAPARRLAGELGKDPSLVELVLLESERIVRAERGVLITELRSGLICANGGLDTSNVPSSNSVALLPEDPDSSARRIRSELQRLGGVTVAVLITDSFGRPWRLGQSEVAIGCAGLDPLIDWRGRADSHGEILGATEIAVADQIAAASDLARDKVSRTPVVVVTGLEELVTETDGPGAAALLRDRSEDLFP